MKSVQSRTVWLKMDVRSWFWNAVIHLPLVILLQAAGWHYPEARWFAGAALGIWIGGFGHNLLWAWLQYRRESGANAK